MIKARASIIAMLIFFAAALSPRQAQAGDDVTNEFRQTLSLQHPIAGNLSGFAEIEYRDNPEGDYQVGQLLWPGITYSFNHYFQLSGGLITRYTDNEDKANQFELRPFAGVKLFLPNKIKWNIYNDTRLEFRNTKDLDTDEWTSTDRLRSRFGVEIPLTSRERAWTPRSWYAMADAEPFYRFDNDTIDPLRLHAGLGYILNDRLRLEFSYYANFTRPTGSSGLEYTSNIFQLEFKFGLQEGILKRLLEPAAGD